MTDKATTDAAGITSTELSAREDSDLSDAALDSVSGGGFADGIVGAARAYGGAIGGVIGGAIRGAKHSLGR